MDGDEAKALPRDVEAPRWTPGRTLAVVAVLGLNAWLSVAVLPAYQVLRAAELRPPAAVAVALGPLPLIAGALLLRARSPLSPWLLVLLFPMALLLPAVAQPALGRAPVATELSAGLSALGLTAYLLGACWALGRAEARPLAARAHPRAQPGQGGRRSRARFLAIALPIAAMLVAAVVITTAHLVPVSAGADALEGTRRTVASAFGLVLWTGSVLLVIAPAARRPRLGPLPRPSRGAAAIWLVVLALAVAMLLLSDR